MIGPRRGIMGRQRPATTGIWPGPGPVCWAIVRQKVRTVKLSGESQKYALKWTDALGGKGRRVSIIKSVNEAGG
jgi:hypothetical protein